MFNYLSFYNELVIDPEKNFNYPESELNINTNKERITKQQKCQENNKCDVKWYIKAVTAGDEEKTIYTVIPLTRLEFASVCKFLSKNSEFAYPPRVYIIDYGFSSEEDAYKHILNESCWLLGTIKC